MLYNNSVRYLASHCKCNVNLEPEGDDKNAELWVKEGREHFVLGSNVFVGMPDHPSVLS